MINSVRRRERQKILLVLSVRAWDKSGKPIW